MKMLRTAAIVVAALAVTAVGFDASATRHAHPWFGSVTMLWFGASAALFLVILGVVITLYVGQQDDRDQAVGILEKQIAELRTMVKANAEAFEDIRADIGVAINAAHQAGYEQGFSNAGNVHNGSKVSHLKPRART